MQYGPVEQPRMAIFAVTALVLFGTVLPFVAGVLTFFVVALYGSGIFPSDGDGILTATLLSGLFKAGAAVYIALRVDRGFAGARYAGMGFLLLVTASTSGMVAGIVGPGGLLGLIALVGIVPLLDRRVVAWCRLGEQPARDGMALLAAVVGIDLALAGAFMIETIEGSPAALQVLVGVVLVGLAYGMHRGIPGGWQVACAVMFLQPFVDATLYSTTESGAGLAVALRFALACYMLFVLVRGHWSDVADR